MSRRQQWDGWRGGVAKMRHVRHIVVGLVAVVFVGVMLFAAGATAVSAPGSPAQSAEPAPQAEATSHVVRVYYFHTRARCVSCRKIEALTHQAIEAAFAKELGDKRLTWEVVNIEDPPNRHFVQDYKLYTKSVVVVDSVGGDQVRWKNLEKVWQLLQNERAFLTYIQDEVRGYLQGPS